MRIQKEKKTIGIRGTRRVHRGGGKGGEDNIGTCGTDEEEDGAVTVLKLSNGVMFRVQVEVQGMQLQAVVDTAAQVTLVS